MALTLGLLLGGATGAAFWFLRPPTYTSYALLRIASDPVQLLPSNNGLRSDDQRSYQRTQVALIKSRPIILAAFLGDAGKEIRQTELLRRERDPEEWLEKELQVGFVEGTEIVRISLSGPNPAELPKIINAVKDAYMDKAVKDEHKQQLALLDELEKALTTSEEKIRDQRKILEKLTNALGTNDSTALTIKQKTVLEEYAALKKEIANISSQLRQIQIKVLVQKAKAGAPEDVPLPESMVEDALNQDKVIHDAYAKVRHIEQEWNKAKVFLKEGTATAAKYNRDHAEELTKAKEAHAKLRAGAAEMSRRSFGSGCAKTCGSTSAS